MSTLDLSLASTPSSYTNNDEGDEHDDSRFEYLEAHEKQEMVDDYMEFYKDNEAQFEYYQDLLLWKKPIQSVIALALIQAIFLIEYMFDLSALSTIGFFGFVFYTTDYLVDFNQLAIQLSEMDNSNDPLRPFFSAPVHRVNMETFVTGCVDAYFVYENQVDYLAVLKREDKKMFTIRISVICLLLGYLGSIATVSTMVYVLLHMLMVFPPMWSRDMHHKVKNALGPLWDKIKGLGKTIPHIESIIPSPLLQSVSTHTLPTPPPLCTVGEYAVRGWHALLDGIQKAKSNLEKKTNELQGKQGTTMQRQDESNSVGTRTATQKTVNATPVVEKVQKKDAEVKASAPIMEASSPLRSPDEDTVSSPPAGPKDFLGEIGTGEEQKDLDEAADLIFGTEMPEMSEKNVTVRKRKKTRRAD
eukprot:TRINITY_DN1872_c0_g2_i10.p1 TRINITY_DN1872_c0_g2~~TRINITY_DN1872_c0_g2_i10.p1  ORF type:complete len:430 (+),score=108.95 TRINITY_DN1872_c0_g2_i10:48-1292(+)